MPFCCFGRGKKDRTEKSSLQNNEQTATFANPRPTSSSQVCPEVPGNDESNPKTNSHERKDHTVKKEDNNLLKKDIKEIQRLTKELDNNRKAMKEKDERLSRVAMEIKELTNENESLRTRLSKIASERLTDGNPNIADLSDENRPTKLAEKYSELYDNEWTNAFELLTKDKDGQTEENACSVLVKALCVIYNKCKCKANENMENMKQAMVNFLGGREPQLELIKPFKDQRKKQFRGHIKDLKKELKTDMKEVIEAKQIRTDAKMKAFLNKCIELCWLMVIQDPSIFMDVNIERYNEKYDSNSFKTFTKSGKYIDYIVWPPIYLHEDGSILLKGVAQCKSEKAVQKTGHDTTEQTTAAISKTVKDVERPLNANEPTIMLQASCENENTIENEQPSKRERKSKETKNSNITEAERNSTNSKIDRPVQSEDNDETSTNDANDGKCPRNPIANPDDDGCTSNLINTTEKNETADREKGKLSTLIQVTATTNTNRNDLAKKSEDDAAPKTIEKSQSKNASSTSDIIERMPASETSASACLNINEANTKL